MIKKIASWFFHTKQFFLSKQSRSSVLIDLFVCIPFLHGALCAATRAATAFVLLEYAPKVAYGYSDCHDDDNRHE